MAHNFKTVPLSKEQINELRKNPLWDEMVRKYGEENVINNYVVDYVVLQEERAIYDKSGQKIDVTADLIRRVYAANQSVYEKFIEAPINKFKSWVQDDVELVGHVPMQEREGVWIDSDTFIITDHSEVSMADKGGLILSGSYKLLSLPNKQGKEVLHLLCKGILLSPEAKWGYVSGNWRQVSPTILASYKISELSYVPYSAQMGNSSLSSGEVLITQQQRQPYMLKDYDLSTIFNKIELAAKKAEDEIFANEVKIKESTAQGYSSQLVQLGIITSGQKSKVNNAFMQLGNGEQHLFFNTMRQFNKHRVSKNNGSKTFFLQGAIDTMSQTNLFEQFKAEKGGEFTSALAQAQAFQTWNIERQKSISLAGGEATAIDKSSKYSELLDLLEKDEEVDAAIKDRVMQLCSAKFGLKLADGTVNAGGVTQPDNTTSSLAGKEPSLDFEEQKQQIKSLVDGMHELKGIVESLAEENKNLVVQLSAKEPTITAPEPATIVVTEPPADNNQPQGGE